MLPHSRASVVRTISHLDHSMILPLLSISQFKLHLFALSRTVNPLYRLSRSPELSRLHHASHYPPARRALDRGLPILRPQTSPSRPPAPDPAVPPPATRAPQTPRPGNARARRQIRAKRVPGASHDGEPRAHHRVPDGVADVRAADQQIGQMYELMNSIRERELAENDPEYEPPVPPGGADEKK
nr:hypothetical protein CFP56_69578 [Quercus suber]